MKLSIIIPNHREPKVYHVASLCRRLYPLAEVIISDDKKGLGKGWAIRQGILKSHGDVIAFIDGDMDIHPCELYKLIKHATKYKVVIGIKDLSKMPIHRAIVSLGYRLFVQILFGLPLRDTQTGVKVYSRDVLPSFITNGFAFDVEMLFKVCRRGVEVKEVPVNSIITKMNSIGRIWNVFKETLKVRFLL